MNKALRLILWMSLALLLGYGVFWLYVRYGGKKVSEVDPLGWLQPDPGTDFRQPIPLNGPGNFRSLGGLKTDSFTLESPGMLFRSDCPSKYTKTDWQNIHDLGIRMVIDLRSDQERIDDPYEVPEGIDYIWSPVYREDIMADMLNILLYDRHLIPEVMKSAYVEMLTEKASSFGSTMNLIADNLDKGIIFHCTAGKDRTGLLAALLLSVAGVDRQTILYDYALSNVGYESNYQAFLEKTASKLTRFGIPPEELKVLFAVDPSWLTNTLDVIDNQYGNMETFLVKQAGVGKESQLKIRSALLGQY